MGVIQINLSLAKYDKRMFHNFFFEKAKIPNKYSVNLICSVYNLTVPSRSFRDAIWAGLLFNEVYKYEWILFWGFLLSQIKLDAMSSKQYISLFHKGNKDLLSLRKQTPKLHFTGCAKMLTSTVLQICHLLEEACLLLQ